MSHVNGTVVNPQRALQLPQFELTADRLSWVERDPQTQEVQTQLVIPQCHRRSVLKLTHDIPVAGHLGQEKTLAWVLSRFCCPGVDWDVRDYCHSWPDCQLATNPGVSKGPLVPSPVVGVPFERVATDLIRPLSKNKAGFHHILVILDYATGFPEAILLWNTSPTLSRLSW